MSSAIVSAPVTSTCPPPPQGSGCAEGYTAACVSIGGQLHPTTEFGRAPSPTGSATPLTHTLCCPRTWNGYSEGIFSFTCGVHPEVTTWSVCHSVVQQETWTETWTRGAASGTAGPGVVATTTWLPGADLFQPPVPPQEINAYDVGCTPAPATGPQTLPTLPTTPIRKSSADDAPTPAPGTPTPAPVPAGAAGRREGAASLQAAVGFVFFAWLGLAAL